MLLIQSMELEKNCNYEISKLNQHGTKTKDANSQALNLKKDVWLWNIQNQINMDFND